MEIRHARRADLPAIVAIYNAAIPSYRATADTSPVSVAAREDWFAAHEPATHPLWVAAVDARIVGWVSLSSFHSRPAYGPTAEISIYVDPEHRRSGVGKALVEHAIEAAPALGISSVVAVVFAHNEPSIGLFEGLGFNRWGLLPRVAHMPDGRRDVLILGYEVGETRSQGV
jgi:phosphinothricin acetyltransferase